MPVDHIRKRGGGGTAIPQGNSEAAYENGQSDGELSGTRHSVTATSNNKQRGDRIRRRRGQGGGGRGGPLSKSKTFRRFKTTINRILRRSRLNPKEFFGYAVVAFLILIFILICITFIIYHRLSAVIEPASGSSGNEAVSNKLLLDNLNNGGKGGIINSAVQGGKSLFRNNKKAKQQQDASEASAAKQNQNDNNDNRNKKAKPIVMGTPPSVSVPAKLIIPSLDIRGKKASSSSIVFMPSKDDWDFGHHAEVPDFGGLEIKFFGEESAKRIIYDDPYYRREVTWKSHPSNDNDQDG